MESDDLWGPSWGGGKCPSKGMQSVKDLPYGIASLAPKEPKDFLIIAFNRDTRGPRVLFLVSVCHSFAFYYI